MVFRRRESSIVASHLIAQCGYAALEVNDERIDDRDIVALLAGQPFAIVLPLSLPRYASLRIAELVALRRIHIRLILVSGTEAPSAALDQLFDCHLPQCGDGLIEALQKREWTHAFERRNVTIDTALQGILRTASCFWPSGANHPELFATLVDYQRELAAVSRHFTVLFVASDPTDAARLRLIRELSDVERELAKRSEYSFALKYMFSSRPDELARRLQEDKPHIVHFSGHGDASGQLSFEDASGRIWPADKSAIAQIFETSRRYVKCVVLNACFSAEQAHLLGQHVEYAIGYRSSVSDEAAIAMAKGFYGTLGATGRVSIAIATAQANLRLLSDGGAEPLYHVYRVPEYHGFMPEAVDPAPLDPALCKRLVKMNQLITDDVSLPVPLGARCETAGCPEFSADETGSIAARFIVPDPVATMCALYLCWARRDGWFIEHLTEDSDFFILRLARGIYRTALRCVADDDGVSLHIKLFQTPAARYIQRSSISGSTTRAGRAMRSMMSRGRSRRRRWARRAVRAPGGG
jgi:hypothetical protein